MDVLEQFLYSIAYKFPKGYPDMNNEQDKTILFEEIKKIGINLNEVLSSEAQKSIDYLNNLTQTTNFQSIREAIATLLEDQMQVLMLASSNDSYIFKVIDSPIVPEIKSKPSRAMICILGTIVGFFLSLISIFVLFLFRDKKLR